VTAFLITASSVLGSGILFGFLPGFLLRPFLWIYPKGSDRPEEILGELYALPYRKRILWAFQHIEVAVFEGGKQRRLERMQARFDKQLRLALEFTRSPRDDFFVKMTKEAMEKTRRRGGTSE
jgi:hypothetical protein